MKVAVFAAFLASRSHNKLLRRMFGTPAMEHCELYFSDRDEAFIVMQNSISMIVKNASMTSSYMHRRTGGDFDWTMIALDLLTSEQVEALYRACVDLVGRPYNVGGVLSMVIPLMYCRYPQDSLFCSESMVVALHRSAVADIKNCEKVAIKSKPTDVMKMYMRFSSYHTTNKHCTCSHAQGVYCTSDRMAIECVEYAHSVSDNLLSKGKTYDRLTEL